MSKSSPVLYTALRPLVTALFRLAVLPKISGKENIPRKGAVVLAGNHTNPCDCFLLMSATRRPIHFLAKDELFRGPLKYFFSSSGIIPVNRRQKDKAALGMAEEYLRNGCVVGIFPEGTINRTHEAPTLPFKIGAVKMASDTGTEIVPFTITGKYGLFSRPCLVFYTAVSITGEDLGEENKQLEKKIGSLLTGEKGAEET